VADFPVFVVAGCSGGPFEPRCFHEGGARRDKEDDMAYRRRRDKDTWHWCTNCSNWPTNNYEEQASKPTSGELCNECRGKESAGTCRK